MGDTRGPDDRRAEASNQQSVHPDRLPHPYQALQSDGTIEAVNEAFLNLLDTSREALVGRSFGELLSEPSATKFEAMLSDLETDGTVTDVELELLSEDGTLRLISLDATVEYDDSGAIDRIHCQVEDVTECTRYEAFIRNSPDIILLHDEAGVAKYVSPAVERELGYDPESLVGRTPFTDVHPDDRERAMETFDRILSRPDTVMTEEFRIRAADGSYVWIESRATNLRDEEGINGILLNSRVIDERKEYETALERQNKRLDDFASVLSHDLRNPLNVAQGRLELAAEECDSDHLEHVDRAHQRMESLIAGLLTLAQEGASVTEREPVDLSSLLEESWSNVSTNGATVTIDVDRTISADGSRLQQVFENLFRNAVEHGGEGVSVTVGELSDGFYVEDDGPGVPEEDREQICEAGYSTGEDGSGLGLSIVSEIVEAHGWTIRVTEGSDGGARFEITGVENGSE